MRKLINILKEMKEVTVDRADDDVWIIDEKTGFELHLTPEEASILGNKLIKMSVWNEHDINADELDRQPEPLVKKMPTMPSVSDQGYMFRS